MKLPARRRRGRNPRGVAPSRAPLSSSAGSRPTTTWGSAITARARPRVRGRSNNGQCRIVKGEPDTQGSPFTSHLFQPPRRLFDQAQVGVLADVERRTDEAEVARHV